MLDIKFIRENAELLREAGRKKHIEFDLDLLLSLDEERRAIMKDVEAARAEQNVASQNIAGERDFSARARLIESMQILKDKMRGEEERLQEVMKKWKTQMLLVPNIPDVSVPEGGSDEHNREERVWGEKPIFNFVPKDHIRLGQALDLLDIERGTKVSGFRGYFLKGDLALLSMSIWRYTMDKLSQKGFVPMMAPALVRRESFMGTGYLPQSEDDLYKVQDELYLAGTAEVPTMGYHMDEVLDVAKFPIKYAVFSPCYRREIGAHGKDTKGLVRVHEFFKVEQIILSEADHQKSVELHEELTGNAEEMIQELGLHYRVVTNCGGDLGLGQVKKYDIEVWVPSEERYRETHSSSYFHDFQTRRLNIRYKDVDGKLQFAHSLNNTALATPRLLVAILENFQQSDGSISVPLALRPYLGKEIIGVQLL